MSCSTLAIGFLLALKKFPRLSARASIEGSEFPLHTLSLFISSTSLFKVVFFGKPFRIVNAGVVSVLRCLPKTSMCTVLSFWAAGRRPYIVFTFTRSVRNVWNDVYICVNNMADAKSYIVHSLSAIFR